MTSPRPLPADLWTWLALFLIMLGAGVLAWLAQ